MLTLVYKHYSTFKHNFFIDFYLKFFFYFFCYSYLVLFNLFCINKFSVEVYFLFLRIFLIKVWYILSFLRSLSSKKLIKLVSLLLIYSYLIILVVFL